MAYVHTPFPQQLVIESTAACDQECIFCGRTYMDRPKKTMRTEMFERVAAEVGAESPYTEIWPTFMGEALLLGDRLFKWIRYARDQGCRKITLNTNGNRLTQHTIDLLLDSGLDRFIVSCDGFTKETYEKVRVGGVYEKLSGGIHLLIDTMRRRGLRRPLLELQFSVFDENEHEVEDFKKYWLAEGVVVKVRPKLYWAGTVAGGDHRVKLDATRDPCLWALDTCGIHANGNVVMCVVDCEGKYVAGNVETQTVKEIWNGPLKWIRELHLRRRFKDLPEICRKCTDYEVKKAQAFFPDEQTRAEYEAYVRLGRVLMQEQALSPMNQAVHYTPDGKVAEARTK